MRCCRFFFFLYWLNWFWFNSRFTFNSLLHRVVVEPKEVELEIADNVPEGWKAMDGSIELDADTNQELAGFFGGRNTTIDGKIWIPYLPRKIIKVAY